MLVLMAGSWAYNVALLAVVYERTQSLAWVGAATLGRFIPQLIMSPYGGVVAERFERHTRDGRFRPARRGVAGKPAGLVLAGAPRRSSRLQRSRRS